MRKKIIAIVFAVSAVLSLSGCSLSMDSTQAYKATVVKLPDGRSVICVGNTNSNRSGISCDWGNAK